MPVSLNGSTSGSVTLTAPAVAGTTTLTFPATTGTINASGTVNEVPAGSAAAPSIYSTGDTNTGIFFPAADTIAFTEGGAEAMRIDSSGQVGIGTSSPAGQLDVSQSTAGVARHYLRNTSSSVSAYTILDLVNNTGSNIGEFFCTSSTNTSAFGTNATVLQAATSNPLIFGTNGTERMRIDSSGNLLVGKTSLLNTVAGSLITSGTAQFATDSASPADGPSLQLVNINASVVNGYRFASFRINAAATEIGTITKASATTVAYNTSSDYRLKENVQPMQNALAVISALKPSTYDWIGHSESGEGFIAHELQEIIPIAVTGVKDAVDEDGSIKPQGVDYSKIVVHLVAAIQEQQAMIQALQVDIAALKEA